MNNLIMIILALFLPFIAVLINKGLGKDFIINVVLCLLGYLPGIIHALWVVTRK